MQTTKTTTDNLFGENLKYYLEKENISQRKFAKLVGTENFNFGIPNKQIQKFMNE